MSPGVWFCSLARKKASSEAAKAQATVSAAPAMEKPDTEALEKQLAQAQSKLETMQAMLEEAKAQQADNVEKLERAVTKNHDRVKRAEEALAEARKAPATQSIE
mgnify:CR=1 FL=1